MKILKILQVSPCYCKFRHEIYLGLYMEKLEVISCPNYLTTSKLLVITLV